MDKKLLAMGTAGENVGVAANPGWPPSAAAEWWPFAMMGLPVTIEEMGFGLYGIV